MHNHKKFAINLALEAGKIIKTNFSLGMKKEWKEDNTPLTATDLKINQMVIDAVKKEYPDFGIIAEEGSEYSGQEYTWVCDPIDGTIPFSHGVPTCMFLLALIKDGECILGVAYDPFMDNLYFAEKGKGAFQNDIKINVSNNKELDSKAVIDVLLWKEAPYQYPRLLDDLREKGVLDFRLPSIGYVDMLVANGEFTATISPSPYAWDVAVSKIIIEEAGGRVTDLYGNEFDFRNKIKGHIASNGLVHEELLNLVKKYLEPR
jgi:myo-inositol-1(or 4)-monophosphatase